MLYNYIKIIHIISATLLLTGIGYSFFLWKQQTKTLLSHIQTLTWTLIIPLALFQLLSGFTMISLQHYDVSSIWIKGSIIGFIIVIMSWISFIYFLLTSQRFRLQALLLSLCGFTLLTMIFFMANKI